MNYLSHYYLDGIVESPYYTFGKVLPDLLSAYNRKLKIQTEHFGQTDSSLIQEIERGVRCHLEADRIFHNIEFFKEQTSFISAEFARPPELNMRYKFFVAHVLLEMVMDRLLLQRSPDLGVTFYTQMSKIQSQVVEFFFEQQAFEFSIEEFLAFFDRFKELQFLNSYTDVDRFIYALSRVVGKVGLDLTDRATQQIVIDKLAAIESSIELSLDKLFLDVKNAMFV